MPDAMPSLEIRHDSDYPAAATTEIVLLSFCTNAPQFSCNLGLKRACITINHS
jgi:hypothetical protein